MGISDCVRQILAAEAGHTLAICFIIVGSFVGHGRPRFHGETRRAKRARIIAQRGSDDLWRGRGEDRTRLALWISTHSSRLGYEVGCDSRRSP